MSPTALVRADRAETALMMAALGRAADYRLQLDKRLARLVVTELGEALKRGRRK